MRAMRAPARETKQFRAQARRSVIAEPPPSRAKARATVAERLRQRAATSQLGPPNCNDAHNLHWGNFLFPVEREARITIGASREICGAARYV